MTTFRQFLSLRPTLYEGISHIEDLSVDEFISSIENLTKMIATQKLDGANLWLGIDAQGEMYTSREGKIKNTRFYKPDDYADTFKYDAFRAAHQALTNVSKEIKSILKPEEVVELEIIFGSQPNAITYGKGDKSYIAFLRSVKSDKVDTPMGRVAQLEKKLNKKKVTTSSLVHDSTNGEVMTKGETVVHWQFVTPELIPKDKLAKVDVKKQLTALKKFLSQPCDGVGDLSSTPMTNHEVLTTSKRGFTELKQQLSDKILVDFKLGIKEKMLNSLLRHQKTKFQKDDIADDAGNIGAEGVVFLDPKSQKMFKLVDRDLFTTINKFNFEVQSKIDGTIKTDDRAAALDMRGGIFGDARIRIGSLFGISGLTTTMQLKRTIRKFKGSSADETVKNFVANLKQINFGGTKKKIEAILNNALTELATSLKEFNDNGNKYSVKLKSGRTVTYTAATKRKIMLSFAETKSEITQLLSKINAAKNIADVVIALFGRQIKDIHAEPTDDNS